MLNVLQDRCLKVELIFQMCVGGNSDSQVERWSSRLSMRNSEDTNVGVTLGLEEEYSMRKGQGWEKSSL